jgi:hypothetical protein
MTLLNTHPEIAARGPHRAFLQAASGWLTARTRRRLADRVRARPRLEGLEDRCLLSPTIAEFPIRARTIPTGSQRAPTATSDAPRVARIARPVRPGDTPYLAYLAAGLVVGGIGVPGTGPCFRGDRPARTAG